MRTEEQMIALDSWMTNYTTQCVMLAAKAGPSDIAYWEYRKAESLTRCILAVRIYYRPGHCESLAQAMRRTYPEIFEKENPFG